ncbi:amidohydrolase family protein [Streptomyces sp. NPDC057950]|uniref:amidohydrolase family protein n=1 Tax=Streptomyces sp. NPDC057950 TaxID=3346288 RepID=UPI0036E3B401
MRGYRWLLRDRQSPGLIDAIVRRGTFVSLTLGMDPGDAVRPPQSMAAATMTAHVSGVLNAYGNLHKSGDNVVIGSDAGIGPWKPHDVSPHGAADPAQLGVTSLEALISMTSRAARLCRMKGRKGRIARGADADLLIVDGDVEHDSAAVLDVQAVFRAGVPVR